MRSINIESELDYQIQSPTSFVFNIASAFTNHQFTTNEKLVISPTTDFTWCQLNDQGVRGIRLHAAPGELNVFYSATVDLTPDIDQAKKLYEVDYNELPTEVLRFLNPSRYCESDRLVRFASKEFGELKGGYFRVEAICNWVYKNVDYVAGSTDASSGACDVLIQRAGVCRDFAHVSIALCRALGIPARYVSGYAVGLEPPDFHGFFEAFLNDAWYMFDATHMAPVSGFVRIGTGLDAADTSFANIVGQAEFQSMRVSAVALDGKQRDSRGSAISTA